MSFGVRPCLRPKRAPSRRRGGCGPRLLLKWAPCGYHVVNIYVVQLFVVCMFMLLPTCLTISRVPIRGPWSVRARWIIIVVIVL